MLCEALQVLLRDRWARDVRVWDVPRARGTQAVQLLPLDEASCDLVHSVVTRQSPAGTMVPPVLLGQVQWNQRSEGWTDDRRFPEVARFPP